MPVNIAVSIPRSGFCPFKHDLEILRGDTLISYLNDMLEIDLPHEESHTVGGLVTDRLGRIARAGDAVEIEGIRLLVEEVEHHSVTEVCIALPIEEKA